MAAQRMRALAERGHQQGRWRLRQGQLGGAAAVLQWVRLHARAHRPAFDQEQADAFVVIDRAGHPRRHDEGLGHAILLIAHGHQALAAIQHPGLALGLCRGGDVVQAVARLALLVGQGQACPAFSDARQPLGLHGGRHVVAQHGHAHQGHGRVRGQHQATAQLFHHHHGLDRTHVHAAMVARHRQAQQAQVGQRLPNLF